MKKPKRKAQDHWLVRPENIKLMWRVFIGILFFLVALDLVIEHHPHFGIDGTIGFAAWFGFFSCVALVVFAKGLGVLLKRPDTYYDR